MGRDGKGERYRGRHRKPRGLGRARVGVRAGVMAICAGLFAFWPQASWADHADVAVTAATHAQHANPAKPAGAR